MMKLWPQSNRNFRIKSRQVAYTQLAPPAGPVELAVQTEGAQLVEFAMVLPLLLVFLIGIIQFGGAFLLKQKMANAAREGARIVVSNAVAISNNNCSSSSPCSIQAAAAAVAGYMTNAGDNSSCLMQSAPQSPASYTWTYSCPNGISMMIDRNYSYTTAGDQLLTGTKVTLTYPYSWFFNNVIKLLIPGSHLALPAKLTETAVMQNLIANN